MGKHGRRRAAQSPSEGDRRWLVPALTAVGAVTAACAGFGEWPSLFQIAMVILSATLAATAATASASRPSPRQENPFARVGAKRQGPHPLFSHMLIMTRHDGRRILAGLHGVQKNHYVPNVSGDKPGPASPRTREWSYFVGISATPFDAPRACGDGPVSGVKPGFAGLLVPRARGATPVAEPRSPRLYARWRSDGAAEDPAPCRRTGAGAVRDHVASRV